METTDFVLVKTELERILSSKAFRQSYILSNFLRYVVIETIEDHSNEIKEYSIAVKALGKPEDFNPQLDAVVRIHAGRLRRCLHLYYSEEGFYNPITISLQKGTYIPQFFLRDMPERSPLIIPAEEPAATNLVSHQVAVLPFKNLSAHSEDHFIVEGFCEQLSSDLALFPEISVLSYFSTSKYRLEHSDIRIAGKELNASHLITGSIYHDKKHLRVSVQLVSVETGIQLWSKTYEHSLENKYLYDVIDIIVKRITAKLTGYTGIILKSIASATQFESLKYSDTLDPVSCYYHYQLRYTEDVFQITRQQLNRTIKKTPDGALPWALLAQLYVDGFTLGYATVNNPLHEAVNCAQKSLQLDPDCQQAYLSLAWAMIHLSDKQTAVEYINRGLSINSNSSFFLGSASFMYALLGEYEQCIEYFEQSKKLNGGFAWWMYVGPLLMHFSKHEFDLALQYANQINIPGVFWNQFFRIAALGQLDCLDEAADLAEQFQNEFPGQVDFGCLVLKKLLSDEKAYHQIKSGLIKAGLSIHPIHLISHKAG
jgi:adenylate cyclase